jgi:serine protease Do
MRIPILVILLTGALGSAAHAQKAPPAPPAPPAGVQEPVTREVQALPSFARLVESVKSAVVNVDVQTRVRGGRGVPSERLGPDLFEHFFGGPRGGRGGNGAEQLRPSAGSGFIVDPRGVILTNNHVVENAVNITVTLDDGRSFEAKVVGRDPLTDVALIRVTREVKDLPTVKLGDSDAMRVGDWVVAIGNPFGLSSSVSAGIVSATARNVRITRYDEFIQTDAAINPGNSGGPLFNMKGEVVGINTAIVGGGSGIGFAVPSNLVKALVPQLEKAGRVTRGYLGVQIQDLNSNLAQALGVPEQRGAIITEISPGGPAARAALKVDDVVTQLNGQPVESSHALSRMVAIYQPGTEVTLRVYREGKPKELKVELGTRPDLEGLHKEEQPRRTPQDERQQRIGVAFQDMDPRFAQGTGLPSTGALIQEVRPGTPAERAELRPGMVVLEAGGKPVRNAKDLETALRTAKPGSILLLRVQDEQGKYLRALQIP